MINIYFRLVLIVCFAEFLIAKNNALNESAKIPSYFDVLILLMENAQNYIDVLREQERRVLRFAEEYFYIGPLDTETNVFVACSHEATVNPSGMVGPQNLPLKNCDYNGTSSDYDISLMLKNAWRELDENEPKKSFITIVVCENELQNTNLPDEIKLLNSPPNALFVFHTWNPPNIGLSQLTGGYHSRVISLDLNNSQLYEKFRLALCETPLGRTPNKSECYAISATVCQRNVSHDPELMNADKLCPAQYRDVAENCALKECKKVKHELPLLLINGSCIAVITIGILINILTLCLYVSRKRRIEREKLVYEDPLESRSMRTEKRLTKDDDEMTSSRISRKSSGLQSKKSSGKISKKSASIHL